MKHRVFVPEPIAASGLNLLKADCECLVPWEGDGAQAPPLTNQQMKDWLYDSEAVVVRLFPIDRNDIERAHHLKVIAKHGVGVDMIDCQAATKHGISVAYTPMGISNGVAEHVIALMLALSRKLVPADANVREGRFDRSKFQGVELAGKVLGVIGMGRIGARVAEKADHGLDMKVHAYDPILKSGDYNGPAILENSLEAVLAIADYVTLHVSLTPQTKYLINTSSIATMKPGSRLINTSRGAVVDEIALSTALSSGRIAGAAIDVFEAEPLPINHPLCRAPNTLLTPHIASSTREALESLSIEAACAVINVFAGKRPQYVVNPEVFEGL